VVMSRPVNLYDRALFLSHGQDPSRFDLVVVKSPHCEKRFFSAWATRLVNVDAPGATSANLRRLGHTRCLRPIFPLDKDVAFNPRVKLFELESHAALQRRVDENYLASSGGLRTSVSGIELSQTLQERRVRLGTFITRATPKRELHTFSFASASERLL
jgi:MlrC C-terminus